MELPAGRLRPSSFSRCTSSLLAYTLIFSCSTACRYRRCAPIGAQRSRRSRVSDHQRNRSAHHESPSSLAMLLLRLPIGARPSAALRTSRLPDHSSSL
jgi:hypothetical protein